MIRQVQAAGQARRAGCCWLRWVRTQPMTRFAAHGVVLDLFGGQALGVE